MPLIWSSVLTLWPRIASQRAAGTGNSSERSTRGSSSSLADAPAPRLSRSTLAKTCAEARLGGVLRAAMHSGSHSSSRRRGVWPVSSSRLVTGLSVPIFQLHFFSWRISRAAAKRSFQSRPLARARPTARCSGEGSLAALRRMRPG